MKSLIRKSIAIFLAGIVLLSTVPFALNIHFCDDSMASFSFMHNAETCGMEVATNPTTCKTPSIHKKSCCKDQQIVKQSQDDLKTALTQISFGQKVFFVSFFSSYYSLLNSEPSADVLFAIYAPPFIKRDVQVLHQSFLI